MYLSREVGPLVCVDSHRKLVKRATLPEKKWQNQDLAQPTSPPFLPSFPSSRIFQLEKSKMTGKASSAPCLLKIIHICSVVHLTTSFPLFLHQLWPSTFSWSLSICRPRLRSIEAREKRRVKGRKLPIYKVSIHAI